MDANVVRVGYELQQHSGPALRLGGSAVGAQFQINSYTTSIQTGASIGVDGDGDFVVTWTSDGSFGTDTAILSIQGQRYASNGSAQAVQFQVNSYTTSTQYTSSVASARGRESWAWDSSFARERQPP